MNDLKLIYLNTVVEYLNIDIDLQLFRIADNSLTDNIEISVYNKRKQKLAPFTERLDKGLQKNLTSLKIFL